MNRLLRWTLVPIVTAGALVAALVPKYKVDRDETDPYWQAWRDYEVAWRDTRSVRELVWRAEARAIARALPATTTPGVTVRFAPAVPAATQSVMRRLLEDEMRDASAGTLRHPIALVVDIDREEQATYRRMIVEPERAGEPCAVVIHVSGPYIYRLADEPRQRLLGTCGFYAAFGEPGPAMRQWLRATRSATAQYLRTPAAFAGDSARIDLARSRGYYGSGSSELYGCRAGRSAACDAVLSPDPVVRLSALGNDSSRPAQLARFEPGVNFQGMFYGSFQLEPGLLGALAAELGQERFGEIWRGTRSLSEAYAAESGRSLTSWVSDYVAQRTLPYHAGPGVAFLPGLLALTTAILLSLVAIARAPRRMT